MTTEISVMYGSEKVKFTKFQSTYSIRLYILAVLSLVSRDGQWRQRATLLTTRLDVYRCPLLHAGWPPADHSAVIEIC